MDQKEVMKGIETILKEKIGINLEKELTEDIQLHKEGLSLDSVMLLELVVELELMYDIEIDEEELNEENFTTIGNLTKFISNKVSAE